MHSRHKGLHGALGAALILVLAPLALAAKPAGIPDHPALDTVRAKLQQSLDAVTRAGLPPEMVLSKIREGLAKGAPPEAILAATQRLTDNLSRASDAVAAQRPGPRSPRLVKAVADARAAGIDLERSQRLMRNPVPEAHAVRAVEVATDLSLRGYPVDGSVRVVEDVLERDPESLQRLAASLESLRTTRGLSRADAVEAVHQGLANGQSSLDSVLNKPDDPHDRGNHGGAAKKVHPPKK